MIKADSVSFGIGFIKKGCDVMDSQKNNQTEKKDVM